MGILRYTCENCGSKLWKFQKHPDLECKKQEHRQKAQETDLYPVAIDTTSASEKFVRERWLRNHGYEYKTLTHDPKFSRYTSQQGLFDLNTIEFKERSEVDINHTVNVINVTERNGTYYLETNLDILIEVDEKYPDQAIENIKNQDNPRLTIGTKENPKKVPETTAYCNDPLVEIGTAHTKKHLVAKEL